MRSGAMTLGSVHKQATPTFLIASVALCVAAAFVPGARAEELDPGICDATLGGCATTSTSDFGLSLSYFVENGRTPSPYQGSRISAGRAQSPIDVWGICRYIDNREAEAYFAPFKTAEEWRSFIAHVPHGLEMSTCARAESHTYRLAGDALCRAVSRTISLPYRRTGESLSTSVSLDCSPLCWTNDTTNNTVCGSRWTMRATLDFLAMNADVDDPSWREVTTYTGAPPVPDCDPRPTNGPYLSECSASCGGTQDIYFTDDCGGRSVTGTQPCNVDACSCIAKDTITGYGDCVNPHLGYGYCPDDVITIYDRQVFHSDGCGKTWTTLAPDACWGTCPIHNY